MNTRPVARQQKISKKNEQSLLQRCEAPPRSLVSRASLERCDWTMRQVEAERKRVFQSRRRAFMHVRQKSQREVSEVSQWAQSEQSRK